MKILLIRPHSEIPSAQPPIGLMNIAAYIRKFGDHELKIHDGRLLESKPEKITQVIREYKPDAVGITGLSVEIEDISLTAKIVKEVSSEIHVIVGGPYASAQPKETIHNPNIDIAIVGEGEISSLNVFNALEDNNDLDGINGIAFRKNGKVVISNSIDFVENLDDLPVPAWDLLDVEKYFTVKGHKRTAVSYHQMKKRVLQIFTSRGCPYRCVYCHNMFGKTVRYQSLDTTMAELRLLKENYNVEEIEILDDIFNVNLKRGKELFNRIIDANLDLKFSFPNGFRADNLEEDYLDILIKGGTYRIVFAIESASPRIQKLINKNVNLEKAKRNIEIAAERKLSLGGFFMLGLPTETEEEVMETINFALNTKLNNATFSIMTPFPGTEIYNQAMDMLKDSSIEFKHFSEVSYNFSEIPNERLEELREFALRKFHLNISRLWSYLRTSPWQNRFFEKLFVLIAAAFFKYKK